MLGAQRNRFIAWQLSCYKSEMCIRKLKGSVSLDIIFVEHHQDLPIPPTFLESSQLTVSQYETRPRRGKVSCHCFVQGSKRLMIDDLLPYKSCLPSR
jgi:hypothetical protein